MKRLIVALMAFVLLAALQPGSSPAAVQIDWVTVGDPGNADDTHDQGYGSVNYVYLIGKYEVTNAQYCEFLNAVAATDRNGLYNSNMAAGWNNTGGISRSGSPGSYSYSVRAGRANKPVNYVSWEDAMRFANWLHNGQPTRPQDATTTEDGAYDMSSLGPTMVRNPGALVFLPSEDEWYKAAYYKGGGTNAGYWDYATQTDTRPTSEAPPGTDLRNGSANYYYAGRWAVGAPYYLTDVGAYSARPATSAYGAFDQNGNVWEWNEAWVTGSFFIPSRGLRGGSFFNEYGMHAAYRGYGSLPTVIDASIGFRVASVVPEPSSLTVWSLLGVLGMSVGWWQRKRAA